MKKVNFLFSALSIFALTFTSCTKDDVTKTDTDNSTVVAAMTIDAINAMDVQTGNQVNYDHSTGKNTGKNSNNSCAVISMETVTSTFPKTYNVDYGTGCTLNGITRKGKLKITFSGYVTVTGSTMTIERENYFINDKKVEGKIVYKNITTSPTVPQWTRTVAEGKFTDNGVVFLNSGTYTTRQIAGVATLTLEDNTYEIFDGKYFVSKENGEQITLTINEPLIKNQSCDYVSKGKLNVNSSSLNGIINYGNGDCDNKGVYTQSGVEFPFVM